MIGLVIRGMAIATLAFSAAVQANEPVAHIFDYQRFCSQYKNRPSQQQFFDYLVGLSGRLDGDLRVYPNRIDGTGDRLVLEISQNAQYFDAFRRMMGMDGVDGRGKRHNLLVNMNRGSGSEPFECGDGDVFDAMSVRQGNELSFDAFSKTTMALEEVVGHEAYHAFIGYNSALEYEFQSGALNEALADAFGVVFRQWLQSGRPEDPLNITADSPQLWQLREVGQPLRDMIAPNNHEQPDHMRQYMKLPNTPDGDWGGVHYNSGIINHAFYLLAEGGQHRRLLSGPSVVGIGPYRALQIWHGGAALMHPHSDFRDARERFQFAAVELFGLESAEVRAVVAALDAVGIASVPLPAAPATQTTTSSEPNETPPNSQPDPVVITQPTEPTPVVVESAPLPVPDNMPQQSADSKRWLLITILMLAGGILLLLSRKKPFASAVTNSVTPGWKPTADVGDAVDSPRSTKGSDKGKYKVHINGKKLYLDEGLLSSSDGQVFGRSAAFSHVILADNSISRRHLRVFKDQGELWVCDLHSTSGTFKNGVELSPMVPYKWRINDQLRVGRSLIMVRKS